MQILAMVTMLIDHIGYIFFPGDFSWRIIGRIAFPVYAYILVQGHLHTSSRPRYMLRLLVIALIAQVPYNLALNPKGLNVVFTLLLSAAVLALLDAMKSRWAGIALAVAAIGFMDYFPFDYNAYGLLLVLIFRYTRSYWMVGAHVLLNIVYLFYYNWLIQMASLLPTLVAACAPGLWKRMEERRMPRWVWWSFYPGHLALLAIMKYFVY